MKLLSIGLVALSVYTAVCQAGCECKPADASCIESCVKEANSCVLECHGNTVCYQDCIDNSWPSAEMFKPEDGEVVMNNGTTVVDPNNKNNATGMMNHDAMNNGTMENPLTPSAPPSSPLSIPSSSPNEIINQQATTSGSSSSMVHSPSSSGASNSISSMQPTSSPAHSSSNILQVSTTIILISSLCGMMMNTV